MSEEKKNIMIKAPNYTQIPNVYFDEIMQTLNQTENIVFLVIMRKTFGWHKKRDKISYSHIMELTGIKSRTTVSTALKGLLEKGLIETQKAGQLISYTVSINELVQKIDQSKFCTGTSPNSVLVEPKTSPNSVHTKETNLNKDKETITPVSKPNPKLIYDEYIRLYKYKYFEEPNIIYNIVSKRISSLLKTYTTDMLIYIITELSKDKWWSQKENFVLMKLLSDNNIANIGQRYSPPKPTTHKQEIKYLCKTCGKPISEEQECCGDFYVRGERY